MFHHPFDENSPAALGSDCNGRPCPEAWVDFDYSAVEKRLNGNGHVLKELPDPYTIAAQSFRAILKWTFANGRSGLASAFRKFLAATATIDPKLLEGASLSDLARELGVGKAVMSKHSIDFRKCFGEHFYTPRAGRENMRAARLKQRGKDGKVLGRNFRGPKGKHFEARNGKH